METFIVSGFRKKLTEFEKLKNQLDLKLKRQRQKNHVKQLFESCVCTQTSNATEEEGGGSIFKIKMISVRERKLNSFLFRLLDGWMGWNRM